MRTLIRAAAALTVLAGLLLGAPTLLIAWVGNPYPPGGLREIELLSDRTLLGIIAILAWIMWALFAACVIVESVAAISGLPARRLPLPHRQQRLARALINAVLTAGITVASLAPSGAASTMPTSVDPSPTHSVGQPSALQSFDPGTQDLQVHAVGATASAGQHTNPTLTKVVERGDTLWGLAERHLGDGGRWREIAALNTGRQVTPGHTYRGSADVLQPGWQLIMPSTSAGASTTTPITVHPGDTLWALADDRLDDPTRWPDLYEANRETIGADPDLIQPGQHLVLPDLHAHQPATRETTPDTHPDTHPNTHRNTRSSTADERRDPRPATDPPPENRTSPTSAPQPDVSTSTEQTTASSESAPDPAASDLRAALLAGGGLLAAAGVAVITAGRHRQHRWRRSGRAIAGVPDELIAVERAFIETGNVPTPLRIDRLLRALAADLHARQEALPSVGAAVIRDDQLQLLFTASPLAEAPDGWAATYDPPGWAARLGPDLDDSRDDAGVQPAPFPTLVAVGEDQTGAVWFINLEATATTVVAGDYATAANLVRFVTSELALNPWSGGVDVVVARSAADVTSEELDPERVRLLSDAEAVAEASAAWRRSAGSYPTFDHLQLARMNPNGPENTDPTLLLTTDEPPPFGPDGPLTSTGFALRLGPAGTAPGVKITTQADRTGSADPWCAVLRFYQLTSDDMHALGELLEQTRRTDDAFMPAVAPGVAGEGIADVAGALLPSLVLERNGTNASSDVDQDDAVSLLPEPDETYLQRTATTVADLKALAPRVPLELAERIRRLDTSLDDDLAAWHDPASRRPRIRTLGPLSVEAWGKRSNELASRLAVCHEVAVYLSCQERGATPEQLAEALGVSPKSIRNRIADTRKLLGDAPDGQPWLPDAGTGPISRRVGIPLYELAAGVQSDAGLFRRLRLRAQAKGADGLADLSAALDLVAGQPFDQMRPGGYGWLSETPIHQFQTAAIVDVAHLAATSYLAQGDTGSARRCCERAILAAPFEDRPKVDLAAVERANGTEPTELIRDLTERDHQGHAEDAAPRTAQVLREQRWRTG